MKIILYLSLITLALIPKTALAHCPLCTVGAGALAVLAASLGISSAIVGILIGGFALALGMWLAKLPKKKYVPCQYSLLTILVYLSTVIPVMPLVRDYDSIFINMGGEYGSLFHNTYMYNLFIVGAIIGAIIVWIAPYTSKAITRMRQGKQLPFQGIVMTFVLLIVASLIIQLTI